MPQVAPESLGWPQPGRRVAILGKDGPVPVGTPGIIAVHRSDPGMMLGYLDQSEETASRFQDNWFLTGDTGELTENKDILYHGRADDMMNAGGFRVSPLEVEATLLSHPDIQDVGVTNIEIKPDTRIIAAFYVADAEIDTDTLSRFVASQLARYKQPRLYRRLASLPRNANNKLLRRALPDHGTE